MPITGPYGSSWFSHQFSRDACGSVGSIDQFFLQGTVEGSSKIYASGVASWSRYTTPLDTSEGRLHGYNRNWGGTDPYTQAEVMRRILDQTQGMSIEEQALLLAIARLESGFNPDAAAINTSAAGVFQIIKGTWNGLVSSGSDPFDVDENIRAGIDLYERNRDHAKAHFPELEGDEQLIMLYGLHHDGPSLNSGGREIAEQKLLPHMAQYREIAKMYADGL